MIEPASRLTVGNKPDTFELSPIAKAGQNPDPAKTRKVRYKGNRRLTPGGCSVFTSCVFHNPRSVASRRARIEPFGGWLHRELDESGRFGRLGSGSFSLGLTIRVEPLDGDLPNDLKRW